VGRVVAPDRTELREHLDGGVGADPLVGRHLDLVLLALHRHAHDLLGKEAVVGRLRGELV